MSDWHRTAAARELGVRYPIIQGPFGGGQSSPELAAAISNLGGLGSYGARSLNPMEIPRSLRTFDDEPRHHLP
jgi:nitronate monooxygenase